MITSKNKTVLYYNRKRFFTDKRPWIGKLRESSGEDFSFVVLGDRCGIALPGIFEKALSLTKQLNPDFVLSVGDLVEGYWKKAQDAHDEWVQMDQLLEGLELPFFFTVGNHDYGNETMVNVWHERKGFEYYAFRFENNLFLVVNTEETLKSMSEKDVDGFREIVQLAQVNPDKAIEIIRSAYRNMDENSEHNPEFNPELLRADISDEQLEFFKEVLTENEDVSWTFVSLHTPAWKAHNPQFKKLEDLLNPRKHTIMAGHLHQLELNGKDDGNRIQMGRTGSIPHGEGKHDINHIMHVSVKKGCNPCFTIIDLEAVYPIEYFRKDNS